MSLGSASFLVVEMPAFLRQQLVLDLHGARARILERAYHVHDIEGFAVSGIAIHQDRQAGGPVQLAHEGGHLIDGDEAEIGHAH